MGFLLQSFLLLLFILPSLVLCGTTSIAVVANETRVGDCGCPGCPLTTVTTYVRELICPELCCDVGIALESTDESTFEYMILDPNNYARLVARQSVAGWKSIPNLICSVSVPTLCEPSHRLYVVVQCLNTLYPCPIKMSLQIQPSIPPNAMPTLNCNSSPNLATFGFICSLLLPILTIIFIIWLLRWCKRNQKGLWHPGCISKCCCCDKYGPQTFESVPLETISDHAEE